MCEFQPAPASPLLDVLDLPPRGSTHAGVRECLCTKCIGSVARLQYPPIVEAKVWGRERDREKGGGLLDVKEGSSKSLELTPRR